MIRLYLKRISSTQSGTWGVILDAEKNPLVVTAEPPESIIPPGVYVCKLQTHYQSNGQGYPAYEITGVTGHTDVEIHIGNIPIPYKHEDGTVSSDSAGCVLTGMYFGARYDEGDKLYKSVI
jgi:hypothetical protein